MANRDPSNPDDLGDTLGPSVNLFKARYVEFKDVPESLISVVLDECNNRVATNWEEKDIVVARSLLCAHMLAMENEPLRSKAIAENGSFPVSAQSGEILESKIGDVHTIFRGRSRTINLDTSAKSMRNISAEYTRTYYGTRFLEILQRNFIEPMVV